ncbi:MAG: SOS response-associated peptidase [Bacteroidia bacterium]
MCYKKNQQATAEELEKRYKATLFHEEYKQFHNLSGFNPTVLPIAEYPKLPVLTAENQEEFTFMQWGLLPFWTPQDKAKTFAINNLNAKAETLLEKKSFAPSVKSKRCIIPVTGFFESREVNKINYPYFIHLKNEKIFSLAGIYDSWKDPESGKSILSYSVITCEANPLMAKIHNKKLRMPVILSATLERSWIAPEISNEEIAHLLRPLDDSLMEANTIDKKINNTRIDSNHAGITDLVEYPELGMFD